ncbi:MAG TPA: SDR family NAD(P)-dependent oxidoreductase [Candidatus Angelobacter sp.]|nr:SDR family NAD(P)-dependent oxidoreductase [Candidatus Angelobacter sp.]
MLDLQGKVAIVTGSGRGIGKDIAKLLKDLHAEVVISDVDASLAKDTAESIGTTWVQADVTKPEDVHNLVQHVLTTYGHIDVLVNNAGIMGLSKLEDISLDQWNKMMAVHLTGTFLCSQAVLPVMKEQHYGKIINISSNWGQRGAAEAVHYCTAKAGIIGFTRALAREVAADGILVNSVAPGPIETDMISEEARLLNTTVEEVRKNLTAGIPLGKLGSTLDVAAAVAFLASEMGNFFCGQIVAPNGGEVMM